LGATAQHGIFTAGGGSGAWSAVWLYMLAWRSKSARIS